jgi:hypothetical protein
VGISTGGNLYGKENMTRRFHSYNSNALPTYQRPNPPPNPPSVCKRCGVIHNSPPVDPKKIIEKLAKDIAREIKEMTLYKSTFGECDCGCNVPVAETPEEMLRFLADRLEYAGTSDNVAAVYARDIRYVLEKHYGVPI